MNTLAELQAAYPGCPNAILIEELPGKEFFWEQRRQHGLSVSEAVSYVKARVSYALSKWAAEVGASNDRVQIMRAAEAEMDTADFRSYVAGKLGAM